MGREASCTCRVGHDTASVKALLESTELILRGAIKRRYAIAALRDVRVVGDELCFTAGVEPVALALGQVESGRWLAKMSAPPPSLAARLGVGPASPAYVLGDVDDTVLAEALHGADTGQASEAQCLLAIVLDPEQLMAMIDFHSHMACRVVWVVVVKGQSSPLGDATIRQTMRAHGYIDNKVAAVSARFTATRYARR